MLLLADERSHTLVLDRARDRLLVDVRPAARDNGSDRQGSWPMRASKLNGDRIRRPRCRTTPAVPRDRLWGWAALPLGGGAMAVGERPRVEPGLERLLVEPAADHQPRNRCTRAPSRVPAERSGGFFNARWATLYRPCWATTAAGTVRARYGSGT